MHLGRVHDRDIYYLHIRSNPDWVKELPNTCWVVFTIANKQDYDLLENAISPCLDRNVSYCCCAGELAGMGDTLFDLEMIKRSIAQEDKTGKPMKDDQMPMTTFHSGFSEGFWFAACVAFPSWDTPEQLLCLDFTEQGIKHHLVSLINQINEGWLPSDDDDENDLPVFDC